jgi:Copper type II ascorbate-dependent monooxygenase, C-terminal domain
MNQMRRSFPIILILCTLALGGLTMQSCQQPVGADSTSPTPTASFALLQQKILTTSCATQGCHASEKDASFNQHGLVLTDGVAYQNLVGVAPKNSSALTDGLKRVTAFNSLQSLLYHKLSPDAASHHAGKQYGNPMPLGSNLLSAGQVEFVRRWIEAGAPKEGNVADPALLDDKTPITSTSTTFTPLDKPAIGAGYQLTTGQFDVAPNFERELFIRRDINNPVETYVNRIQIKMRANSHHFIAYGFTSNLLPTANTIRDLRNADNSLNLLTFLSMQNHVFVAGSSSPNYDYTFPEGAALQVPANTSLDLNSHYVNKTTAPLPGEAMVNFYTVDAAKVKLVVKTLNLANQEQKLQPNTPVTLSKTFIFAKARTILALTSHTHKLGEKFVIKISGGARNGEIVYTSTDWESPEMITFTTPIKLNAGEGLTSEITYNNTTSKVVTFGLTSNDEMGIIFGYYYE